MSALPVAAWAGTLLLAYVGPVRAQTPSEAAPVAAVAPATGSATSAAKGSGKTAGKTAGKAVAKTVAKTAARAPVRSVAKGPVASKNVALGEAAVPAPPKAFLADGCLDAAREEWLRGELGDEPGGQREPATASAPFETTPEAGGMKCVPFASVMSPERRIESMVFLPTALSHEVGELRRAKMVSRLDLSAAPVTSWHDFAEAPAGYREVWVPATSVLAGEAVEAVPTRWQRDVTLLVRQMKRQVPVDESAWVRLLLNEDGEDARLVAAELVDETGQAIDSAIWLDRAGAPGGFVSARGGDHERLLWQAPVDYRRISRGVGAATVIVRKRVFAQPKTPGGKPRLVVRSFRTRGQHLGIDFAAPTGTPVVTVADGTVVHAGKNGGYGNLVVDDHGGGVTTYYAHLSAYGAGVQEGAKVERGQEIGLVGSTGMSTGPHLHYEIRKDGRYLDPADPTQTLPNWNLAPEEHEAVLTRLLALSLTRPQAFARAARAPAIASVSPQSAAAE
jgi:murein DD-endopeptidase MepM/ murein hydrolase activator NlpD